MLHRRRDARGIRDTVGVLRPTVTVRILDFTVDLLCGARNVTWTDYHRESQTELPMIVVNDLLVFDLDRDLVMRSNVRHRDGKDIRTFLFQKTGTLSFLFCLLI